jgi:hypothetical protein
MQKPTSFRNEGQVIAGTLHLPEGVGRRPAVLLCHGFTGSRIEAHFLFVKASRALERAGIASLRFDFRGSGESEGAFREMTQSGEVSDAHAALSVLARQRQVDASRLGILGLSMGGLVAASLAGRDERIQSVALWSAVANMRHDADSGWGDRVAEARRKGFADIGGHALGKGFFEDLGLNDPLKGIAASAAGVLIVHGESDAVVPVSHADQYQQAARRRGRIVRKVIIPGADHVFSRLDWEKAVIEKTVRWFRDTL